MIYHVLVRLEKTDTGYSAYAPDMPGVIATGSSVYETKMSMVEAIGFHIKGMKEDGDEVPSLGVHDSVFAVEA